MITVKATDRTITAVPNHPITSGSVGLPVSFIFSDAWDDLTKIAVFMGSGTAKDVALFSNECVVPAEVLAEYGDLLWIGVYGANGDGDKVMPTMWCKAGLIVEGTAPSESDPADPTPNWVAQVQEAAATALEKAEAVEAEAAAGSLDGATFTPSVASNGDLSWTNDQGKTNPTTVNIKGPKGDTGDHGNSTWVCSAAPETVQSSVDPDTGETVIQYATFAKTDLHGKTGQVPQAGDTISHLGYIDNTDVWNTQYNGLYVIMTAGSTTVTGSYKGPIDGTDGISPGITVESTIGGHSVTITDAAHPVGQTFNVMDGTDGVSPGVAITSITGGNRVTVTDKNHPTGQTFDVMDGEVSHASMAAQFSTSTAYAAGDYVWYSGQLYRFTAAHAAGSWTGSDAVEVELADDVRELRVFLTPEMFGAKGDGTTDDTSAWQQAVDAAASSGVGKVVATKKSYKVGQINVTSDTEIDCNGADFVCTAAKLFNCCGSIVTTLSGESNYSANQTNYAITNDDYDDYTGFAFLKGTNNYFGTRSYFLAGFACTFFNGKITSAYPIDVTTVSIDIINPITVHISNIGNIQQSVSDDDCTIYIKYGLGCTVSNMNTKHGGTYVCINLDSCIECVVDNCNIVHSSQIASKENNSYLVCFSQSSYCTVKNSYMYNKYWHCITTGDIYLCYHNVIDNCKLFSDYQLAFCDHDDARNTIITNTTATSLGICGLGVIDNCEIYSVSAATGKPCYIVVYTASTLSNSAYEIQNVKFWPDSGVSNNFLGVQVKSATRVANVNLYLKKLHLKNLMQMDPSTYGIFSFDSATNLTTTWYDIEIEDCNFCINLCKRTANTTLTITDFVLRISDCMRKVNSSGYSPLGLADGTFGVVHISDSVLGQVKGTFKELHLNNFKAATIGDNFAVTDLLTGSGIHSQIKAAALLAPSYIQISDLQFSATNFLFNIYSDVDTGDKYYQRYKSGVLQTLQLT